MILVRYREAPACDFVALDRAANGSQAPTNPPAMVHISQGLVRPDSAVKVTLAAMLKVFADCCPFLMHSLQHKVLQSSLHSDSLPDRRRSAAAAATGQPYQGCSLQPHPALAPAAAAAAQLASSAAQFAAAWQASPYLDPLPFWCMTCAPRYLHRGEGQM